MCITNFIISCLILPAVWLLLAAACNSWGVWLCRLVGITIDGRTGFFARIWLGWCFSILVLAVYHLFLPINAYCSAVLYLPAIVYFFFKNSKKLIAEAKTVKKPILACLILLLLVVAATAIQAPICFDTGLYHLNSIRWLNEHHIINGLGNLHTRLGFNQIYFLYAASLNFHPLLNDFAFHAANSFLFALLVVDLLLSGSCIDLLIMALLHLLPMPLYWVACPTPDLASALLQLYIFRLVLLVVYYRPKNEQNFSIVMTIAITTAILIALKLSNGFWALGLFAMIVIFCKNQGLKSSDWSVMKKGCAFIIVFFAIWVIRGYIQTGYPLFPSAFGKIDFDWTLSLDEARKASEDILVFARLDAYENASPLLKNYGWMKPWFEKNIFNSKIYVTGDTVQDILTWLMLLFCPCTLFNFGISVFTLSASSIFIFGIYLGYFWQKKQKASEIKYLIALWLICAASLVFWFVMAPATRFSNAVSIMFFIVSCLLAKPVLPGFKINYRLKCAAMVVPIFIMLWQFMVLYSDGSFNLNGLQPCHKASVKTMVTDNGLSVLIPVDGTQTWDSAIPSTPEFRKGLALRTTRLEDGFCIKDKN